MEYAVYLDHGEVRVAEAEAVASALHAGCRPVLVTTGQAEVAAEVGRLVLLGYSWSGNEWLAPPEFSCDKCGRPAEPDGNGGYRHAEAADATACEVMFGGGMLRSLFEGE